MATLTNTIPEKTIERLSEYRRTLLASHRQGITHIFSHVLAGIHGITAVQVRRDLMLIEYDLEGRSYTPLQTTYRFGQPAGRSNHVNGNWTRVDYNKNFTITIQ